MEEFKGTKGIWSIGDTYINGHNVDVYPIDSLNESVECLAECYGSIEDANLIATAPELLEALQNILKRSEIFPGLKKENEEAKRAIGKALGN